MLEIVKKRITLTKGDDGSVWLRPKYKDKSIYTVQEGDRAFFRISAIKSVVEIECNVNVDANKIVVSFVPNDTKDLAPGIYRYEAELITSWGMHYTFLADETFILGAEIEKHISNANSNGNYGNNIPSVDGELEDEPVVDGDIQPTNPLLDYETLNHLPKVNGNTLIGNKSNEQLGIPTKTSDLENDSDFVSDDDYQHTDNNYDDTAKGIVDGVTSALAGKVDKEQGKGLSTNDYTDTDKSKLDGIETGAEVNVQTDWNEVDSSADDYLKNKPTLGTAAAKNFTSQVASGSTDLVESGAVKTAIDNAVAASYHHAGVKMVAELVPALLIAENQGNVYNITDDGVTTADFIEGAGIPISAGDNVGIAKVGSAFKFDLLSGFIDTSNFVEKSATSGLIRNDGSIDTNRYALYSEIPDISGKADKVLDAVAGSFPILLANGNVGNSGKMPSDFALKSEMSVTDGTGADADKVTIQLKSGTSATVLKTHQDISGKADKVSGATNGNLAGLDANGNLTDSGVAKSDIDEMQDELSTDYATVEGNPINFTTLSAQKSTSTILSVEPIQDLHGYDKPWTGGAGRNLLSMTVDSIKSANTAGTWNGNVYSYRGIDTEILVDNDNNVLGFKLTGTASPSNSSLIYLGFDAEITNGAIFSSLGQGAGTDSYAYQVRQSENYSQVVTTIYDEDITLTRSYKVDINIRIASGYTISNALMVYPMVRATTDTNPNFEPYTNICGISGKTSANLEGLGANIYDRTGDTNGYYISATGVITQNNNACYSDFIPVSSGVYVFSGQASSSSWAFNRRIHGYDINKQWVRQLNAESVDAGQEYKLNAEVTSDIAYICLSLQTSDINAKLQKQSNNITWNFGQTVYGCKIGVESGVLTIGKKMVDIGDMSWNYNSTYNFFFSAQGETDDMYDNGTVISSAYDYVGFVGNAGMENLPTGKLARGGNTTQPTFKVKDTRYTDVPTWKTALTGQKIVYELKTPTTIQLTPHAISILKGVNYFSTDGDNITLTFRNGEFATLGDLENAKAETDVKIAESQILTDSETGKKYKLVVANGVLDIEEIIG